MRGGACQDAADELWRAKIRNNSGRQEPRCGPDSGLSFVMVSSSKYNTLVSSSASLGKVALESPGRSRVFEKALPVCPEQCRSMGASQPDDWAGLGSPGPGACPAEAMLIKKRITPRRAESNVVGRAAVTCVANRVGSGLYDDDTWSVCNVKTTRGSAPSRTFVKVGDRTGQAWVGRKEAQLIHPKGIRRPVLVWYSLYCVCAWGRRVE